MESPPLILTLAVAIACPALHFIAYALCLREWGVFQTERGIFLYHFAAGAALTLIALVAAATLASSAAWATAVSAIACQGIYSLSFLEVWSLTQGSNSIGILATAAAAGGMPRERLIASHVRIGDEKKAYRLVVVERLGLVRIEGGRVSVTGLGGLLAAFLAGLHWLAKLGEAA
ncbi:MAG: hypothetical protein ACHQF3_08265 [Alphaproteobacteria bacterium]